jgi:hypothetical protein
MTTTCPNCSARAHHHLLGRDEGPPEERVWTCTNDACGAEFVTDDRGETLT